MDNPAQTREWNKFAEMDFTAAKHLSESMNPAPVEIVCYHCQQSAEKYLKGFLVLNGIMPPRTHDQDELCKSCAEFSDTFLNITDACSELTNYGVQARYPFEAQLDEHDMRHAIKSAGLVKDFVSKLMSDC